MDTEPLAMRGSTTKYRGHQVGASNCEVLPVPSRIGGQASWRLLMELSVSVASRIQDSHDIPCSSVLSAVARGRRGRMDYTGEMRYGKVLALSHADVSCDMTRSSPLAFSGATGKTRSQ